MIIKFLKNFAYSFTVISLLIAFLYNVSLTNNTNLLIFVTFLVVVEMFIIPPLSVLLYPLNFLVFGQLKNFLLVLGFILLLQIIPFAKFDDFFFNQTQFMGILIPQISLSKYIFIFTFALVYEIVKNLVFADTKKKR